MIRAVTLWGGPRDGQTKDLPAGILFFPSLLPLGPEGVYLFHHFEEQIIVYRFVDFEQAKLEDKSFSQWEAEFDGT